MALRTTTKGRTPLWIKHVGLHQILGLKASLGCEVKRIHRPAACISSTYDHQLVDKLHGHTNSVLLTGKIQNLNRRNLT